MDIGKRMITIMIIIIIIVVTIIAVIVIFSVLVLIHEYGHFIAARRAGIKVREFGIGFPPRIFFKKIGEEVKNLTKQGQSETTATLIVMRKHQAELQKLMMQ